MGVYIGYVDMKGNEPSVFFNYKPIAEVRGDQIIVLSPTELEDLLPDSELRNINFCFSWDSTEERRRMDSMFRDNSLTMFEFTLDDLEANVKSTGERNRTGYKVSAMNMLDNERIRHIDAAGVYYAVRRSEISSNFKNDAIVEIDSPFVMVGDRILVELEDGFWAGPYEVGYRDYTSSYYVKPQIKENKYTVSGYSKKNIKTQNLISSEAYWGAQETSWTVLIPRQNAKPEQIDVINDKTLIESFKDSLENSATKEGKVQLDNIPALLTRYEDSALAGSVLSESVRKNRLNRLASILTSEQDIDKTLETVADFICNLLVKYQDSPNVEEWLKALLSKHPEFADQLRNSKAVAERIAQMEQSLESLHQQKLEAEAVLEAKKQEVAANDQAAIVQAAIESKEAKLLEMDAEYASLLTRIGTMQKTLSVGDSIAEAQKKLEEFQQEIDYLERHKSYLERDTSGLEFQFQQLISRSHEKMVEIAFDGFMSSKMLNAAAEWETEESNSECAELLKKVNTISVEEKKPEEFITYLCRTVQTARPTYSKNVIVNIAICITQGFLTVFSGEPGSGKTSICNIVGQVLGLNKLADCIDCAGTKKDSVRRFIPISVERGWTSKRDFVGYYNPLSKTFDKSNRRVYDALRQLDAEKREGIAKFPYLMLLDEANLSPMEYYWSDFMNICDDLSAQSSVNLGENYVYGIPETLHFLATINNDHTTETLSPRLIDRAWIITLPQQYSAISRGKEISDDDIDIITWNSLRQAFIPRMEECIFSAEIQKIYDEIITLMRKKRFTISPRIDMAIKRYWAVASKWFEMDETKTDATIVAFDYAVAQRILPKIVGNGEAFESWLVEFRDLCSKNSLNMCATVLNEIMDRGNQQMKYYQFFS